MYLYFVYFKLYLNFVYFKLYLNFVYFKLYLYFVYFKLYLYTLSGACQSLRKIMRTQHLQITYCCQFKLVAAILPQPVRWYISMWVVVKYPRERQWVIYTSYVQWGVQVCLIFSKVCSNHDNATRYIIHKQFLEIKLLI